MNSSAARVGFVVDQLGEGGGQRVATLVAAELHALGFPTRVLSGRSGSYASELPQTLPVHVLAPRWPKASSVPTFVVRLCREVRRQRIDVVFANGFAVGRLALLLRAISPIGLSRRTHVIVVEHNTLSVAIRDRFPNRLARSVILWWSRWLYRRADAILGVSQGVSRDLERTLGLPPGSVTTIYNPVDAHRITEAINGVVPEALKVAFEALPRPIVITTGRLVAQKAHRDLLEAFAALREEDRGSLVILGEGPLREDLERQAHSLGIRGRVWMPGFVDNPWWFMARADVFVLSSHWEGFGLVLVEALACGVPVVSTDCPSGPREILEGIGSARLTPVGNPKGCAAAIAELLAAKPTEVEQGRLSHYAPAAVAARYVDLVEQEIIRDAASRRPQSEAKLRSEA